ncbi:dienelactone hydrolase family protein [Mycobacterium sp. C31M]
MWNSFDTGGDAGVSAQIISYRSGDEDIHAYHARPAASDRSRPGIVLIHHLPGWDEFYQEFAERLARHGYDVIAPDLYCRAGHSTPDDVAAKVRSEGGVADDQVVADLAAARSWLFDRPNSNGRVGIMGSCSGGRHAVLTASRVPGFDAVVDLWGGAIVAAPDQLNDKRPVAPIDYTADLQAPLLGIFGNDDQSPSPEQVDIHERELQRLGKDFEFHRYDGAGHGFFYYHTPRYRPEQTMDAWGKLFTFLDHRLAAD